MRCACAPLIVRNHKKENMIHLQNLFISFLQKRMRIPSWWVWGQTLVCTIYVQSAYNLKYNQCTNYVQSVYSVSTGCIRNSIWRMRALQVTLKPVKVFLHNRSEDLSNIFQRFNSPFIRAWVLQCLGYTGQSGCWTAIIIFTRIFVSHNCCPNTLIIEALKPWWRELKPLKRVDIYALTC